jgi:unsaturated chondroitin disaccharide hydrolase
MLSKATWRGTANAHLRAILVTLLLVALALSSTPPRSIAADPFDDIIQHDLQFAAQQLDATTRTIAANRYPSTTSSSGSWNTTSASGWTSGFFSGALWLMYQRTGDATWRSRAQTWTSGLESQKNDTSTHDVGFKIFTSFGNGYRLTGDDAYRQVILTAAASLATRYDPDVGCIRSWGEISDTSNFEVIIDNMMNLELLFWASKHGGQAAWYDMAVSHALKTMANHVRADGSTYQVVTYDPTSGAVKSKSTNQGYNTESTWSRGQAWAVYGFTMAYRETGDPRFLDMARRTADYFIAHLPSDKVPYWDFELPSVTGQPRDSSAAAIAASGLIELSQRENDAQRSATYLNATRNILTSLSSPAYLAEGTTNKAILLHGTQNKPNGKYDSGLIYGDYYFVEALLRYPTTPPPPDTTPPTITARAPATGAVDVPLGANVTATFSEAVTNVTPSTFTLRRGTTQLASSVSYDAASRTATLDPGAELSASTLYTATLTNGIIDLAGNTLAPVSWIFTTAAAPPPPGNTFTFDPAADTYVDQANPTTSYGSAKKLGVVGGGNAKQAFIRFVVAGIPAGAAINSAKLHLFVVNDSSGGGTFYRITNTSWPESTTWNTKPSIDGPQLSTLGAVTLNAAVEVDLTPAVAGNGTYSFAIAMPGTNTNNLAYASREATTVTSRPRLDVMIASSSPPDTTPPTVTARTPAPGAASVPLGANVTAMFSEAVTNITPSTFTLRRGTTQIAASLSYDAASRTATLDPGAELSASSVYTATLTNGITDLAGNPLAPVSWIFTTDAASPPGGTRIKAITFEDGSLTHPTSGVDSINGGVVLISAGALKGIYSAQILNTSAYLQETFADADEIFVSIYLRLDALPSADSRIVLLSNGGTTVGNLLLRPDGTLLLRNASTAIGSPFTALRTGTLYRIGLHQKRGSGGNAVLEAYVAIGDAAFGGPFASSQTQTFTSAADRLRLGATTGALNAVFDDITLDAAPLP